MVSRTKGPKEGLDGFSPCSPIAEPGPWLPYVSEGVFVTLIPSPGSLVALSAAGVQFQNVKDRF